MDNLDKILKLVEAGYTKDEISSLLNPEIRPEPASLEPEIKEEPEEPKEQLPDQSEYIAAMKDITDEFKKIRDDLRRSALISDGTQIADPLEESRKVLASIIDPPNLKKGNE